MSTTTNTTGAATNIPTAAPSASMTDNLQQGLDSLAARIDTARELLEGIRNAQAIAMPTAAAVLLALAGLGVRFDREILEGLENSVAFASGRCGPRTEERLWNERGAKAKGKAKKAKVK